MRLLHTSDWHLGRSLAGLSLLDDQAAWLCDFVTLARDVRPHVTVLLGDLFDRPAPSSEARSLLDETLRKLVQECKTRVIVAPGRQDHDQALNFGSWLFERKQLDWVSNVNEALSPLTFEDADGPVHVNVIPFLSPAEVDAHFRTHKITTHAQANSALLDHLTRFRRLRRNAVRGIVAGYLWVEGGERCGEERPLDAAESLVGTASFEGIDYVALGYLHRHQSLDWRMVYSGSPFALSFESQPVARGVVRMEMDEAGRARSELVELPLPRRFVRVEGTLEQLRAGSRPASDICMVAVRGEGAALGPELLRELRDLYPGLWRVERTQVAQAAVSGHAPPDFAEFYSTVTGAPLRAEEQLLVREILGS